MDHPVNSRMESVNLFGEPDEQAHPVVNRLDHLGKKENTRLIN
jgi:hypothetical protein